MLALLYYCLKVIICSGILYGYYLLVLRNNRFHQWSRYYLLAIVLLSFTLPFLQIPIPFFNDEEPPLVIRGVEMMSITDFYYASVQKEQHFHITLPFVVTVIYSIIALFFTFLLIRNIWKVQRLKSRYPDETLNGIHFYNTQEPGTPFSFFNNIFWNSSIALDTEKGRQMLRHELTHVQEKHSFDKVTMELLISAAWWNPFLYYIRKELAVIHEFIADQKASAGDDKLQYASLLLMKAMGSEQYALGNPFFHSQLKRRLTMLTTIKNPRFSYLRRLLVLPLAALAVVLFSFKYKEIKKDKLKSKKEISAVLSAKETTAETFNVHGFYQDTTKKKYITKTDKKYKGKFIESITLTTDKKGIVVKTTDKETYFLNREEALKELGVVVTDKGVSGANGVPTENYSSGKSSESLSLNSLAIQISGDTSGIENALIIIDGIEVEATKLKELATDNIESIDVLKGESAITKYGLKAKYGVMLITTKKSLPDQALYLIDGNASTKKAVEQLDPRTITGVNVWKGNKAIEKFGEMGSHGVVAITTKAASLANEPLYIIDGVESIKEEFSKLQQDVSKIESVDVLKDEAATKAYGDKGKNGVILITTKKQAKTPVSATAPTDKLKEVTIIGYGTKKTDVTTATPPSPKDKLEEVTVNGYQAEPKAIFTKAEIMPSFPGGIEGWRRYLMRNLQYPKVAQDNNVQGTIRVQVTVEADGSLSEVKALNDLGGGLADEAIRIIKNGPKWIPAEQNGRKVASRFVQTISFRLSALATPVS